MKNDKKLYVPSNIILEFQWWKGFGNKELLVASIAFLVMLVFSLVSVLVFKMEIFLALIISMSVLATVVMSVQKSEGNISFAGLVNRILRFNKEQQTFMNSQDRK